MGIFGRTSVYLQRMPQIKTKSLHTIAKHSNVNWTLANLNCWFQFIRSSRSFDFGDVTAIRSACNAFEIHDQTHKQSKLIIGGKESNSITKINIIKILTTILIAVRRKKCQFCHHYKSKPRPRNKKQSTNHQRSAYNSSDINKHKLESLKRIGVFYRHGSWKYI